jgi:hypothetical protein
MPDQEWDQLVIGMRERSRSKLQILAFQKFLLEDDSFNSYSGSSAHKSHYKFKDLPLHFGCFIFFHLLLFLLVGLQEKFNETQIPMSTMWLNEPLLLFFSENISISSSPFSIYG